ncbi:MAG: amidase [Chloroflexi bacterium]|nr:MAG: amidase [Chloroflexota bacterium]MBL1197330.1 amidase [Chloroflexota bacterium]NOH14626.1 amidase [Chloroflexota bacterium]
MNSILEVSATKIAQLIRSKQASSLEVVDAYLERINAINPKLNAVVQLVPSDARQQAKAADAVIAEGGRLGPLHGVPITVKDSFDTEGIISTGGTMGRKDLVPRQDATAIARLRAAGAIILGKTNTPELTLAGETNNLIYGRTNNPYDISLSPTGSSGGSAAIVAAGGSPLDVGSDVGGSIRVPAHVCGITGIKPTSGRVPRTGHIVDYRMGALDALQQIGPMARYVEDLELALSIMAGPDGIDPAIVSMPLGNVADVDLGTLRVAYYLEDGVAMPTQEIRDTVERVAKGLEGVVLSVEAKRPPELEESDDKWWRLFTADGGATIRRILDESGTTETHPSIDWVLDSEPISAVEYNALLLWLDNFRSRMLGFMQDYDVLLCPVSAYPAVPHGEVGRDTWSYINPYNFTGWPAATVRAGSTMEGLPIGVQVVARPWREDMALAVCQFIEDEFGGWQPPEI